MGLENIEIQPGTETRATSVVVHYTIPSFVHSGFKPSFPDGLITTRVATAIMQIGSPIFKETAEYKLRGNSDLALKPTGLEPYVLGGMEMKEVVRYMAGYGIRDQKSLRRYFGKDGYNAVRRADELLADGKVDPRNPERDFRILTF